MDNIKNIIFDLGGVILNIDLKRTEIALEEMGIKNFRQYLSQSHLISFFKQYEAGKIDDSAFISKIQSLSGTALTEEAIVNAWNALLLDFPPERIELLQRLKKKYRLFLLSNTNAIHYKQFQKQLYEQTGCYLEDLFEKTYYSHTIGLCKPDVAAYQFVIDENKLDPAGTIFIDDTEVNMAGAIEAGLHVYHLKPGKTIMELEW